MRFTLIRADDQLTLEVETFNLEPQRVGDGYQLRPPAAPPGQAGPASHIAVGFPVQHVMEYAGTEAAPFPAQTGPIFSAAGTRVVFVVPAGSPPIPFTVAGILGALPGLALATDGSAGTVADARSVAAGPAASTAELVRAAMGAPPDPGGPGGAARPEGAARAAAAPPGDALLAELAARARARRLAPEPEAAAVPKEPTAPAAAAAAAGAATPGVTGLGFPAKLYLSVPGGATRMAHAAQPVEHGGNVELWHSRLARRTASGALIEPPTAVTAFRALVLQPTTDPALSDARINSPLSTSVQSGIATQTTQNPGKPATARQLMLSPLGAWLDARGSWPGFPVEGWRHRMVMGRDHYVQVVERGRLYPLGHQAVLVSTMERTVQARNGRQAGLVRRSTIHVLEPERDYGTPADAAGRRWPWQTVELLTLDSPSGNRVVAVTETGTAPNRKEAVYLNVDGLPFRFDCLAVDRGHRVTAFDLPLLFVPESFNNIAGLQSWLQSNPVAGSGGFRALDLDGQEVALAPADGGATPPDTTTVVAHSAPLVVEAGGPLGFRPALPSVRGVVPALARFATAGGGLPQQVTLAPQYLQHGFNPAGNPGEALFAFAGPVVDMATGATGGMISPRFGITGLSRRVGLVAGDLGDVARGAFDVRKWLAGSLDALTLFGVFKLTDLIPSALSLAADAPRMVTQSLDGLSTQELKWDVPLLRGGDLVVDGVVGKARLRRAAGAPEPRLLIHVKGTVDPATHRVRTSALCQVTNLELVLELLGEAIVTLPVPLFEFKSVDERKPDVNVVMGRILFGGVLRFVETLASLVDQTGLSDPPAIEQLPNGISSSFSAPIPAVAVGMFSLENIVFGAQLFLYYDGTPLQLALNFATEANPFRLSVSALAGGGYLKLLLTTRGLDTLMGSLEFGAALSVRLGVASGSVSVMGGIAFFVQDGEAMLTGYLRVRGEVQVLGLISVCVESTLSLTYNSGNGKVEGVAEWVFRVKVLFLRKTVKVRFEKRFAGANGDPTFAELMAPEGAVGELPWDAYCTAFAEA